MTYGEIKQTKEYIEATDVEVCINGEISIEEIYYDEMYDPEELDDLQVVGIGYGANGSLLIDLVCENWDKKYDVDWVAQ